MAVRFFALTRCFLWGFWRRTGLVPLAILLAALGLSSRLVVQGTAKDAAHPFLGNLADLLSLNEFVCLCLVVLVGLQSAAEEREQRIELRMEAFPVRGLEHYAARFAALFLCAGGLFVVGAATAFALAWRGSGTAFSALPFAVERSTAHHELRREPGGLRLEWRPGLGPGESFAAICEIVDGSGVPAATAATFHCRWIQGDREEDWEARILARRRTLLPRPLELPRPEALLIAATASDNPDLRLRIMEAFRHRGELPFLLSLGHLLCGMLLRLAIVTAFLIGLSRMVSLETGAFAVAGIFCVHYLVSVIGEGAIHSAIQRKENVFKVGGAVERTWWWERGLMSWTEKLAFLEGALKKARRSDELHALRGAQWIESPWAEDRRLGFLLSGLTLAFFVPFSLRYRRSP